MSLNLEKLPQSIEALWLDRNRFTGTVCFRHLPASLDLLTVHENTLSADPMDGHLNVVGRSSTLPRGKLGATRDHERGPPEGERREEYRVTVLAKQSTASVEKHPGRGMKLGRKATVRAHTC